MGLIRLRPKRKVIRHIPDGIVNFNVLPLLGAEPSLCSAWRTGFKCMADGIVNPCVLPLLEAEPSCVLTGVQSF